MECTIWLSLTPSVAALCPTIKGLGFENTLIDTEYL